MKKLKFSKICLIKNTLMYENQRLLYTDANHKEMNEWVMMDKVDIDKQRNIGLSIFSSGLTEKEIQKQLKNIKILNFEYLHTHRDKIWKIRKNILKLSFDKQRKKSKSKAKPIEGRDDWISKVKYRAQDVSWLPTKEISKISSLEEACLTGKDKAMLNSVFSVKVIEPSNRGDTYLELPRITPKNEELEEVKIKTRKTRVYFTTDFSKKMKSVIGAYRYFYNQGLRYLMDLPRGYFIPQDVPEVVEVETTTKRRTKSKHTKAKKETKERKTKKKEAVPKYILYEEQFLKVETGGIYAYGILPEYDANGKRISNTNFMAIRAHLKANIPEWFHTENLPVHLIDQASREIADKYKDVIEARSKDNKPFKMKFKSKKNSVIETVCMEAGMLNKENVICPTKFKDFDSKVYTHEPLHNNKTEYEISYNRNTYKYHIHFLIENKKVKRPIDNRRKVCSIDPGEVVPFSIYDPQSHNVLLVGENHETFMERNTISTIQRKISRCKIKQVKEKLKSALQRTRDRIKNRQQEMHYKLANYLCSNFKHIILPNYKTANMKLHSQTNLGIREVAFYTFLKFLKHQCVKHNTKLYLVGEHLTTKTCCCCGTRNDPDKKDSRKYVCHNCGVEIHRDANGAVNIYWKHTD